MGARKDSVKLPDSNSKEKAGGSQKYAGIGEPVRGQSARDMVNTQLAAKLPQRGRSKYNTKGK